MKISEWLKPLSLMLATTISFAALAADPDLILHYRFDKDAGLRIGRQVADLAIASDVNGHGAFAIP